jgi:hypothetical protein
LRNPSEAVTLLIFQKYGGFMKMNYLALITIFASTVGFAADDTHITFGKITSGATGTKLTSITSKRSADASGRYAGFAFVEGSDAMRLDAVKLTALVRPQVGLQLTTTSSISNGFATADVTAGSWTRPSFEAYVEAYDYQESNCPLSWGYYIGALPQPDGAYTTFSGLYCTTYLSTCTPTDSVYAEYGSFYGPESISEGYKLCYLSNDFYHEPDDQIEGDEYTLRGQSAVNCTDTCEQ